MSGVTAEAIALEQLRQRLEQIERRIQSIELLLQLLEQERVAARPGGEE